MINRIVKLTFKDEYIQAFKIHFETVKSKITNNTGCEKVTLLQDANNPNVFFTYSLWLSEKHLDNYRNTEFFNKIWSKVKINFSEKPQVWTTSKISSQDNTPSNSLEHPILFGNSDTLLNKFLQNKLYASVFILVDENTENFCLPVIKQILNKKNINVIKINSGEINKNLNTCQQIWKQLIEAKANRNSLLINLGGGVIGDMGGFCASCYKRGIDFLQIPTTLLSQVDASVGGKLGIDFMGLKNVIGQFKNPQTVIIDPNFLNTLPFEEIRSGYAEMLKHALIHNKNTWNKLAISNLKTINYNQLLNSIKESVQIKAEIVDIDPFEKNIRKKLNLGHTIGHAVETYFLNKDKPILHGEAVAYGIVAEANIAVQKGILHKEVYLEIKNSINNIYDKIIIPNNALEEIIHHCYNDKKNEKKEINASLIKDIGEILINQIISEKEIKSAILQLNEN